MEKFRARLRRNLASVQHKIDPSAQRHRCHEDNVAALKKKADKKKVNTASRQTVMTNFLTSGKAALEAVAV